MSRFFYPQSPKFPPILQSCIETYLLHIAEMLYGHLTEEEQMQRIVLANIQSGSGEHSRYNIDRFKSSNPVYPFTAYNVMEQTQDEEKINHFAKRGKYYNQKLGGYITVIPYKVGVPLISFFTTASDYYKARSLLQQDAASLTRFHVPIRINEIVTNTSFNVGEMAVEKGQYAFEFEEFLTVNNIYDIVHTVTLEYNEVLLEVGEASEVETFTVEMVSPLEYEEAKDESIPVIESMSIADDQTGVSPNSFLEVTFSEPMRDGGAEVRQSFEFLPESLIEYSWNVDFTILSIRPEGGFSPNTLYVLHVRPFLMSQLFVEMQGDFQINFETGL